MSPTPASDGDERKRLRMELRVSEDIRHLLAIDLSLAKADYDNLKANMLAERSKYNLEAKTGRDLLVELRDRYLALKKIVKSEQQADVATQTEDDDNQNIDSDEEPRSPRKMEALVIKQACSDVKAELTAEEPLEPSSAELPAYYETVKAAVFAELEALREIVRLEMDELRVQKEAFFAQRNADVKPSPMQLQVLKKTMLCVKNEPAEI